jgi:hypothetical protein
VRGKASVLANQDRVRRGRVKPRSAQWAAKARELAHQHGLKVDGLLDMHDHMADLLEWEGADRTSAEFYAWEQLVDIVTRSAA